MRSLPRLDTCIAVTTLLLLVPALSRADPPATRPTTQKARPVLGIFILMEKGDVLINHVRPGSRAEHMGLKSRDIIKRIYGEDPDDELSGPWISECAAQFIPCVSEEIYHRRYQEADKIDEEGREIDWPIPYWWVDIGATMQNVMLAAVAEGLGCGFAGGPAESIAELKAHLAIPDEFWPIGVMPVGKPLRDVRSPSLKRGWVPFEDFARWERW